MTAADERLKEARAAKILAETAAFKIKRGDFITKAEHEEALNKQRYEILKETLDNLIILPELFHKAGLFKKDKIPKAKELIRDMLGLK